MSWEPAGRKSLWEQVLFGPGQIDRPGTIKTITHNINTKNLFLACFTHCSAANTNLCTQNTPVFLLTDGELVFLFCLLHLCELFFKKATVLITHANLKPCAHACRHTHTHTVLNQEALIHSLMLKNWLKKRHDRTAIFFGCREGLAEKEALLAAHLSVTSSILAVLQGTHGCRVWSWPQVKAQAQQRWSRQMTLQLFNQVLLFLQLITLRQRKRLQ